MSAMLIEEQTSASVTRHINRVTAVGVTRKNKEETKHMKQISKRSRRTNRK